MLTKNDLLLIKQLFEENNVALLQEFDIKIDKKFEKKLKPILKEIRRIGKDLNITITSFDREIISTKHQVELISNHLHLPQTT